MTYKPPFWLPIYYQGNPYPEPTWHPPTYTYRVEPQLPWQDFTTSPGIVAQQILDANRGNIENFVQRARLSRDAGIIDVVNLFDGWPQINASYNSIQGRERVDITVYPQSGVQQPLGDYVLIQFQVTGQGTNTSGPNGTFFSFATDPNGTEVAAKVNIGDLISGSRIVYQNVDLTITKTPNYFVYTAPEASVFVYTNFVDIDNIGTSFDEGSLQAFLEGELGTPPVTSGHQVGYGTFVTILGNAIYQTSDASAWNAVVADYNQVPIINSESLTPFGTGSYSIPTNSSPGPYQVYTMDVYYSPQVSGQSAYYTATMTATFVIQLPQITTKQTTPAFSINTTGYPWNATISIYPSEDISVDPTNPSFPLKWTSGKPPLGADGKPWAPRGTPDTNVQDAYIWQIFYEDQGGTAVPTSYPFVVTFQEHLETGVPVVPSGSTISPLNYSNKITQMWPTFLSGIVVFGLDTNDWGVNAYTDVPYGRLFNPPPSGPTQWQFFTAIQSPPLPLIAQDTLL